MADGTDAAFEAMIAAFGSFLSDPNDQRHWEYACRQYHDGRFLARTLVDIMNGFNRMPPSSNATEWATSSAADWETIDEPLPGGTQAWPTLEQSFTAPGKGKGKGSDFEPEEFGKGKPVFEFGKGNGKSFNDGKGNGKNQNVQRGKGDGGFQTFRGGKGDGKFQTFQGGKGDGNFQTFHGGKNDGKFQTGGKWGRGGWKGDQGKEYGGKNRKGDGKRGGQKGKREMTAVDISDAQRRLDLWLAQHPDFVFRPRAELPAEFKEIYEELGEEGEHLWKNLRHHLAGDDRLAVTGRLLQFMAEKSTWKVAKNCILEKEKKLRKEIDAQSSRLSVRSGYTGFSRRTMR